jgi:HAD superfamily hydrolase (TIGR01509 family)
MKRALLLDLDGTLADSLPALRAAYFTFLSSYGAVGSDDEFQSLNGLPLNNVIGRLQQAHELSKETDTLLCRYLDLIAVAHSIAEPAIGAASLLAAARNKGWLTGVVTSAPRQIPTDWLSKSGLAGLIDAVVGSDDVDSGKPSPAPYQLALTKLDCSPSRSIAVEDSPIGAKSAIDAGLNTFVIADPARDWPSGSRFITTLCQISDHL